MSMYYISMINNIIHYYNLIIIILYIFNARVTCFAAFYESPDIYTDGISCTRDSFARDIRKGARARHHPPRFSLFAARSHYAE